jgi:hypothetical protein
VSALLVALEISVEPPNQLALEGNQPLVLVGHADQAPEMALGVDPAQRRGEDIELAGIVGHDHGVGEQAARHDGTDHGSLSDQAPVAGRAGLVHGCGGCPGG